MIGEDIDSIERGIAAGDIPAVPLVLHGRAHHAYSGQLNYRADVIHTTHVASFTNACQATLVRGDIGLLTPVQVQAELTRLHCNDSAYTPYQTANEIMWRYAVAFLTTELPGDNTYRNMLTPGWAVSREPLVMFFESERRGGQTPPPDNDFPDESWFHFSQPDSSGLFNHPDMVDAALADVS
jgi:hypothetical protein